MKKAFFAIYSIITIFCLLYGLPLAFINAGKEGFYIYLSISIVGVVLLCSSATYLMYQKTHQKKNDDEED